MKRTFDDLPEMQSSVAMTLLAVAGAAHALSSARPPPQTPCRPAARRPSLGSVSMVLQDQSRERGAAARDDDIVGVVQPSASAVVPPPPTFEASIERLMELVTQGSGRYASVFWAVLIVSLHAVLAFGTLSGVLLDAQIIEDVGVSREVVTLGNSLVFFGWIPGA
eukprot:2255997-Prymnesium_polylepis.1